MWAHDNETKESTSTWGYNYSRIGKLQAFQNIFGVSPEVCGATWILLEKFFKVRGTPEQFLWAMMHLKVYASEDVTATLLGVDPTTFQYYVWYYIKKISKIFVVLVSQQNIKFFNTCIKH